MTSTVVPSAAHEPRGDTASPADATRLDWAAFAARFYPDSRRHDLNAVVAYDAYRRTGNLPQEASR